jgi:hypothetical protein
MRVIHKNQLAEFEDMQKMSYVDPYIVVFSKEYDARPLTSFKMVD